MTDPAGPAASSSPEAAPAFTAKPSRGRRLLRRLGPFGLVAVGSLLIGLVLGLVLASLVPSFREAPTPVQVTVPPEVGGQIGQVILPDVRGLSERDARQALADHGIPASKVSITTIQHLTPDGFIAAQDPIGGTVDPEKVTLSLPTRAYVPDLAGQPEEQARSALLAMGAQVEISRRYEKAADPGTVLSTEPDSGKPLVALMKLLVAAPPQSRPLADLVATGACGQVSSGSVDGNNVGASVQCNASSSGDATYWLLKRRADRLTALVGLEDHADPAARVRVSVIGDGRTLYAKKLAYGHSQRIELDTADVLRLTVRVQRLDAGTGYATLVLGDGAVTGSAEALAALENR